MSYLSKLHREKDEMRLVGFARVFSRLCARNAFMKWRMRGVQEMRLHAESGWTRSNA